MCFFKNLEGNVTFSGVSAQTCKSNSGSSRLDVVGIGKSVILIQSKECGT